jgi:hypothetical protein
MVVRRRILGLIVIGGLAACARTAPAETQTLVQLDLPTQPLGDSLRGIGLQTSINVLFDPSTVNGQTAPAFHGRATIQEVFDRILVGTDLSYRFIDDRTVTLVRRSVPAVTAQKLR